ncbi:hypothetical protein [Clostridium estertheticum]|nr:hypothetical protein [Clostridium estertheticum]MCB2341996.1 hypothetical protein [Clostridium estertheticum]
MNLESVVKHSTLIITHKERFAIVSNYYILKWIENFKNVSFLMDLLMLHHLR